MIKDLLEPPKLKTVRSPPLGGQEGAILGYDSFPIKLDPKRSFSFHHPQDTYIGHSLYYIRDWAQWRSEQYHPLSGVLTARSKSGRIITILSETELLQEQDKHLMKTTTRETKTKI